MPTGILPMFNLKAILAIFKKELKFTLRDADLILTIVILPMFIYPLMAIGGTIFLGQARQKVEKTEVKVVMPEIFRDYAARLATETVELQFSNDLEKSLQRLKVADIDAVVEIATAAADFAAVDNSESLGLRLHFDRTRWRSEKASDAIHDALFDLRRELRDARLKQRNIPYDLFVPIRIVRKNIAPSAKMGGSIVGDILPTIIIIFSLLSAFYSAIDLTTGEKERGTLETIMLSPVPFKEIMIGKFLTVISVILLSVASNLIFLGGTVQVGLYQFSRMIGTSLLIDVSLSTVGLVFLVMIPFAATMAATMMAIAFMARSMKEAQNYLAPLLSLMILPAFAGAIPGIDLNSFTAFIPIVNLSLMFKAFFVGDWSIGMYLLVFAGCSLHCLFTLALASRIFRSEDLFDRGSSDIIGLFYPARPDQTAPTARAAIFLFGITISLAFAIGETLQNNPRWSLITGLALLQLVVILLPALVYLLFYRYRIVTVLELELKKIRIANIFLVPMMSLCVLVWVMQYSLMQNYFFPAPKELNQMFLGFFDVAPVWYVFVVGSLLAGFCEELLFRGMIFKGLKTRVGAVWALLLSSAMFGFFHITPYKMVTTALIGLWLGFLFFRSRSLWTSIYAHAFNNAVALAGVYAFYQTAEKKPEIVRSFSLPLPALVISALVFLLLLRLFNRINPGEE